jgi:hypothetical protein
MAGVRLSMAEMEHKNEAIEASNKIGPAVQSG